jgi:hypothetical protein
MHTPVNIYTRQWLDPRLDLGPTADDVLKTTQQIVGSCVVLCGFCVDLRGSGRQVDDNIVSRAPS